MRWFLPAATAAFLVAWAARRSTPSSSKPSSSSSSSGGSSSSADRLSRHFTLGDVTASATASRQGIPNNPGPAELAALRALATRVLDPLVDLVGPLRVTSGYRSTRLNDAVNGASDSQHTRGEAVDVKSDRLSSEALVQRIRATPGLVVDQVILYAPERGGHVHVSYTTRRANRGQYLFAPASGGYRSL